VVGWQIAALLSANLAGLQVGGTEGAFRAGGKWLDSCMKGSSGSLYGYQNLPDPRSPNVYYWYYATQVMHHHAGDEWGTWNRAVRKILVQSQCKAAGSCANGSWDPEKDPWGRHGGRMMTTALGALTLEIYYRYLPLFKSGAEAGAGGVKKPRAVEAEKK
jgi:hypothetical protein